MSHRFLTLRTALLSPLALALLYVLLFPVAQLMLSRSAIEDSPMTSVRRVYAKVYYPLRWFQANRYSLKSPRSIHEGVLGEVGPRTLVFERGDSTLYVGFTCEQHVCAQVGPLRPGMRIRAVFGVALPDEYDSFINKLLSIESVK